MQKSKLTRWSLKGSAAVLALLGAATSAQAYEYQFGDVHITFDSTVSVGTSLRTADRNEEFLNESNGGSRIDQRFVTGFGTADVNTDPGEIVGTIGVNGVASAGVNREGSVNGDDGRLNYNSGDLTSANAKLSHDLEIGWENYKIFMRGYEFYDAVLDDGQGTDRSDLSEKVTQLVGRNAVLLDAFVSADYTVGDLPLNVRAGKQVISWGEGTFLLNGINVINPIDVSAFRRPGAEIKDGLIPVNSLFASIGLPFDGASLSGYYMLDWQPFRIDQPGTPFSGTDVFGASNLLNTDPRGNQFGNSFLSGNAYGGSFRRNCNTDNSGTFKMSAARQVAVASGSAPLLAAYDAVIHTDCAVGSDPIDFNYKIPTGQLELIKNTFEDESIVTHDGERKARDEGQFGLRLNYLAEELNGTEFGFYYQNDHSRLPIVGFHAGDPTVAISTISPIASASGRATAPLGFLYSASTNPSVLLGGAVLATDGFLATLNPNTLYGGGATERTLFQNTLAQDSHNYEGVMANIAAVVTAGQAAAATTAAGLLPPGPAQTALLNKAAALTALGTDLVTRAALSGTSHADFDNLSRINALLVGASLSTDVGGKPFLMDGAELLGATNNMSIYFEYPEDIEQYGFSFNTTIGSWGVQGEMSYRPNAPFQLDTDQLTIASALTQCAAWGVGTSGQSFQIINTVQQYNCPYNDDLTQSAADKAAAGISPGNQDLQGYIRGEMFTAQIGTTATFSGSEWFIDAVSADLGVLVTEVGMVYVPGVEDTWIDKTGTSNLKPQYQNIGCQGSDLPLGGLLDLRHASSAQCRPTDTSAGLVMLYRLDYNNAFDTGFVVSPQITYSWDFEGTTPVPYGNFLEDRQAVSLGVSGQLNNNFKVGASYTNYFGGHINNKATDQDFASLSASYSF